jgi:hypothetical protein
LGGVSVEHGLDQQLETFRQVRRNVEAAVLPLATSVDGRRFSLQASLHGLELRVGGYVVLEGSGHPRLGQVLTLELDRQLAGELALPADDHSTPAARSQIEIRYVRGEGLILEGDHAPFHDAQVRAASGEEVQAWLGRSEGSGAKLQLGELALVAGVPCVAAGGGFDRHTFLCGQSGSGKTYSLGVILERLLIETGLRLLVLDPNSDFVRLGDVRTDAPPTLAAHYAHAASGVAVYSAEIPGLHRLRLRASEMEPAVQAALMRLDPIDDREEYAALATLLASEETPTLESLTESEHPDARRLGLRIRSLGIDRFGVWARDDPGSVLDAVHDQSVRCVVVDLGSLATRAEQSLVAATVLSELWRHRQERMPILIVIDEAHNVCPAEPQDQLSALAADYAVRIAAEGRKFGLYLLVSTQRPQKIPENVLSQADNLVLLRLNSLADAAFARAAFSFVPPSLIERAVTFRQGEALIAGKISPQPALLRFGARITEEGGADVPTTWAAAP